MQRIALLDVIPSAVTFEHAKVLYCCARDAPPIGEVVEIGSDRGKSTVALAWGLAQGMCPAPVHAVDPFVGGTVGSQGERVEIFRRNVAEFRAKDIVLHVASSGEYARIHQGCARLVFIDAAHDYANSRFDFMTWKKALAPGGFLIAHDVDNVSLGPGTRRAFIETVLRDPAFELYCRVDNLAVARRP